MASAPEFAAEMRRESAVISTANTARDGTGTIATVFTAGANGSLIRNIIITALGTTTAGVVRLFLYNSAVTTYYLWKEIEVQAKVPSGTAKAFTDALSFYDPEPLPNGWSIRAATNNAESFAVHITGGDV